MHFPVFETDPPPLHAACATGDPRNVLRELNLGANPLTFDSYGLSPLHYACSLRETVCLSYSFSKYISL